MNKIVATFSNGFTDEYKGKRAVKAAWMITEKATGKVLNSGHSQDFATARKTAENSYEFCVSIEGRLRFFTGNRQYRTADTYRRMFDELRAHGVPCASVHNAFKVAEAYNAETRAMKRALVEIEVVAL